MKTFENSEVSFLIQSPIRKGSTYLLLTLFLLSFLLHSQENDVYLKHYLRKLSLDTLIFPGQRLEPNFFLITFPDSIYNQTNIKIPKLQLSSIGRISCNLRSKAKKITYVSYYTRNEKKAKKISAIIEEIIKIYNLSTKDQITAYVSIGENTLQFKKIKNSKTFYFEFKLE